MTNKYVYMDTVNEFFKIKKGSTKLDYKYLSYIGLLYPTGLIFDYGRPSLFLEIFVARTPNANEFRPQVTISSIDDSSCLIHGAIMSLAKAERVVEKLKEYFDDGNCQCPTKAELIPAMQEFNMCVVI